MTKMWGQVAAATGVFGGHDYIGHGHIGHDCIEHGHIDHNYIGHGRIGHNYTGHTYKEQVRLLIGI